jgi:phage virion morphogenesis protein
MAGAFLQLEITGLDAAMAWLNRIGDPRLGREGLVVLGGLAESQTRRRIAQEKTAPDGEVWAPWSEAYAKSRRPGHSLLQAEGSLLDSIAAYDVSDDEERVGSNLVYAAIHQAGGLPDMAPGPAAIPARPYLGLSDANIAEANEALTAWIEETLP